MLKWRLISFPLLLGLFAVLVFCQPFGRYAMALIAPFAAAAAAGELALMIRALGVPCRIRTAAAAGFVLMLPGSAFLCAPSWTWTALLLPVMLCSWGWFRSLAAQDRKAAFSAFFPTAGAVLLSTTVLGALLLMYEAGAKIFLFLVLTTKMMDTGGYIVGRSSQALMPRGNHRMIPSVSPGKSWEGTAGGLVFSMLCAWALSFWCKELFDSTGMFLLAGLLLGIGSLAGDLTESALKRACGMKDSGHWIPGMGGIWDVLDSFLYNAPLFLTFIIMRRIVLPQGGF